MRSVDERRGLVPIAWIGSRLACTYTYALGRRYRWPGHHHVEHELLWAPRGPVRVIVADRVWAVPPGAALWIPSGIEHDVSAGVTSSLHCVFFDPELCPVDWSTPMTVPVDALARELPVELARPYVDQEARCRLEQVLFDRLLPAPAVIGPLALPSDPRAHAVAVGVLDDISSSRTLESWGREVAASVRTLSRAFRYETGLSFVEWRAQARLQASVDLLAGGVSVTSTALAVGYSSVSTFIEAFRARTGMTPGVFAALTPSIAHASVTGVSPSAGFSPAR